MSLAMFIIMLTYLLKLIQSIQISVGIVVTPISATPGEDYVINATRVTLLSGQRTAAVPISIVDDGLPEFDETFSVRLVTSIGGVIIVDPLQCVVTIEENDYPYGLIGMSLFCL